MKKLLRDVQHRIHGLLLVGHQFSDLAQGLVGFGLFFGNLPLRLGRGWHIFIHRIFDHEFRLGRGRWFCIDGLPLCAKAGDGPETYGAEVVKLFFYTAIPGQFDGLVQVSEFYQGQLHVQSFIPGLFIVDLSLIEDVECTNQPAERHFLGRGDIFRAETFHGL